MEDRLSDLGFSLAPGIGPKRYRLLVNFFGSSANAWNADETDLHRILGQKYAETFISFRKCFLPFERVESLSKQNISFIGYSESMYPELLRTVVTAPIVLYARGNTSLLTQTDKLVAVVGTRKITAYGRQVTESMTAVLVHNGCIIVSGLALGVDTVAHETSLEFGGNTIAVLGSGIDRCYPESNALLYKKIIAKDGLILSEYAPGIASSLGTFPARNRIIAGISRGIVVTQGAEDSGSLITADLALVYQRTVFAVPGPITSSLSVGPNSLLKKGAVLVTDADDILQNLKLNTAPKKYMRAKQSGDTPEENKVITLLEQEPLLFDEVVKRSGFSATETGTLLSLMEMKGYISADSTGTYTVLRN